MFRKAIIRLIDPFGIIRNNIVQPLFVLYDQYRESTLDNVREVLIRLAVILFVFSCVLWSAIFFYVTFYYSYMPQIAHMRPVHMQYKTCENNKSLCTFPAAHVSLTKRQQLLMLGQPYKVYVNIEMPESHQNRDLGMFLVCAEMRDQGQNLRGHSCRSAMLRYKSDLLTRITTWVLSPLFILGMKEEKQTVQVELFSDYLDEKTNPVTNVFVEIQSAAVQFYDINLQITAQFTGLRYFMFHWPVLSAVIGTTTNLILILLVLLLSWYHWSDTAWVDDARDKYQKRKGIKPRGGGDEEQDGGGRKKKKQRSNLIDDEDLTGEDAVRPATDITTISDKQEANPPPPEGLRKRVTGAKETLESDC